MLSKELREAFIQGLLNPEMYDSHWVDMHMTEWNEVKVDNTIFIDKDLQIEVQNHNRPLYLEGNVDRVYLNSILVDSGSIVNLMPYYTVNKIVYTTNDLEFESIIIQGFNINDQSIMGSIRLTV